MAIKQITTQAYVGQGLVFNRTIKGAKHWREEMREAMKAIDENAASGCLGLIRQQQVGARGWGVYRYSAFGNSAERDQSIAWPDGV